MPPARAVLFLCLATIGSLKAEVLPPWNSETQKAWWDKYPSPDQWPKAADELQRELEADSQEHERTCFSMPDFQGWLDHLEWIRLGLDCPDFLKNPDDLRAFVALGKDEAVSHLFVEKMQPLDVRKAALENLLKLEMAHPDTLPDYAALGVAFSLVFDQPFPDTWPHSQVKQSALPLGDLDVVKRYEFYVKSNQSGLTEFDLAKLPFDDLKFLVDSKVQLSEFEYAQKNRIPLAHFDDAFFSIEYDTSRIQSSTMAFTWNHPSYTLKDIETLGGICVDQAYYATTLGKGRGIPTIYFTGYGTDGGHAWFGYLGADGKWVLDCGRYASQNYPKGFATDPQTWRPIKDTALEDLARNGSDNPNCQAARTALAWARLHADKPVYRTMLDEAREIMPELAELWVAEGDFIDNSGTSDLDDKRTFYYAWIKQFTTYPDMKVDGQKRLMAALKQANDPEADSLARDIVLENRTRGFDLGIESSSNTVTEKLDAGDWENARLEFEKSVRDFHEQGGSTFFYDVIYPYISSCMKHAKIQQAQNGVNYVEDQMSINDNGIMGSQFSEMKSAVDMVADAVKAMGDWLDEVDSGDYERCWNDSAKSLQENAPSSDWVDRMNSLNKTFGRCTARNLVSAPRYKRQATLASGKIIRGRFMEAKYDSVFDSQPHADETVLFQRESDGHWRAADYGVKVRDSAGTSPVAGG